MKYLLGRSLHIWLGALCLLSAVLFAACSERNSPATDQTKATITKLLNDFLTFNGDSAQHDRFWADDLVYTSSAGKVKTKAEIMQGFADAAKAGAPKVEPAAAYSAEDVLVRVYGETAALTFRLVARYPDGTRATFRNSGTLLHRKGQWQVITWQATKEPLDAK